MSQPLVALVQPAYSQSVPYAPAKVSFLRPSLRHIDRVELGCATSMLTRCFNSLWAMVLNEQRARQDRPITHFAMLHDDIGAMPGWLDVLLDELEATGADVLSAVVPIKDSRGVTSTALENPNDPWFVRRLTLKEIYNQLPETFGANDIPWRQADNLPLLVNTGCWICRWGHWAETFTTHMVDGGQSGFRFKNRIVQMPDGEWMSQDQPEDWLFGRWCHEVGLKVRATRKVKLEHGSPIHHNFGPRGDWPTDMAWLEYYRRLHEHDAPSADNWRFPGDVTGWLSEAEGRELAALARDKTVLEIGSYCGRSTICLAQTAKRVCAVDTFDGRQTVKPDYTLPVFMANASRYGVLEKITVYQGEAMMVVPGIQESFDLAFIDSAHHKEAVLEDARVARQRLATGGLLAFHDYARPGDEGVTEAVDMLIASGCKLESLTDTIAVLRP